MRQRIRVEGSTPGSLRDLLGEVFGEPVSFSVTVGTARVNRKPVLEAFDARGTSRGFVKIGMSPVAAHDVAAETAALARIVGLSEVGITVPRLLWAGDWRGAPVLVMSGVPRGFRQRRGDRSRPPVREMRTFSDHFARAPVELAESAWAAHARDAFATLSKADAARRAQRCLQVVLDRAEVPVAISAWHGDWTPWNMARHGHGLGLWDWERFTPDVPAGLDALHYAVNVATVRHGAEPDVVLRALAGASYADAFDQAQPTLLAGIYLAAINARYLPLAEGPGGAAIAARAGAFLRAWECWSDQGSGSRGVPSAALR